MNRDDFTKMFKVVLHGATYEETRGRRKPTVGMCPHNIYNYKYTNFVIL